MLTGMGLALGIDYALFVVSRYREERGNANEKLDAIAIAGATATRAVFFSGVAFVLAMFGMVLVPDTVLRSLATGAILVGVALQGRLEHVVVGARQPVDQGASAVEGARRTALQLRIARGGGLAPERCCAQPGSDELVDRARPCEQCLERVKLDCGVQWTPRAAAVRLLHRSHRRRPGPAVAPPSG